MNITFPEGIFYNCISCGVCCRHNWQMRVEEEKKKSLEDFAAKCNIEQPLIIHPMSKSVILRSRKIGGCIFLEPDNFCMVHRQLGMDAKPLMCQTFPVKPIKTPDGYYIRISFGCNAVRKNLGLAIDSYSDDIKGYIEKGFIAGEIKYPVFFQHNISLDEATNDYLVKNFLLKELKCEGVNSNYFLKIWNILWNIFYQATAEQKDKITIEMIEKNITAGVGSALPHRPDESGRLKRNMFYAIFLGYELVGREEKNPLTKYINLVNLIRNRGDVNSKYGKLKLQDIEKIKFDVENPQTQVREFLTRYYGHIIESKWMLIAQKAGHPKSEVWAPTVINSWGLLSLFYGLIIWFSKMFAYARKSEKVEIEDAENAVMIVDIEYVSHISREWLFLDLPVFAKIFDQLSNTPNFVPTIL